MSRTQRQQDLNISFLYRLNITNSTGSAVILHPDLLHPLVFHVFIKVGEAIDDALGRKLYDTVGNSLNKSMVVRSD
jgi:hypothetical protein